MTLWIALGLVILAATVACIAFGTKVANVRKGYRDLAAAPQSHLEG